MAQLCKQIGEMTHCHLNQSHGPYFGEVFKHLWVSKAPIYRGVYDSL